MTVSPGPTLKVIISVGSNIDPQRNIWLARKKLEVVDRANIRFLKSSPIIQTEPREFSDQPSFLNGAFLLEASLDVDSFKQTLTTLESGLGRERTSTINGPRTIDLDIIAWDGEIIDDDYHNYDLVRDSVDFLLGLPGHI